MKTTLFPSYRWSALAAASIFALQACGGGGGGSGPSPSPPPPPPPTPPVNRAPVISSPSAVAINEGVTGTVYTLAANDPDGDALTRELVTGGDAGVFAFNAATGTLSLTAALNFAAPQDANGDNIYEVTFRVSDGRGGTVTRLVQIQVQAAAGPAGMALRRVATGLSAPLYLEGIPGTDRVVVLEKGGRAKVVDPATGAVDNTNLFLNISAEVSTNGEQGLVGMAFSPNFTTDRTVFVNLTNVSGNTEIRRYQTEASNPLRIDPSTMDIILTINQVDQFHNGGWLGFGNDGMLYVATGDGGGSSDSAAVNAQDTSSLLGKILRIDPIGGDDFPDANRDYRIPSGNAFPGGTGGAAEIFAVGLRNPWRSSFDPQTGDLFIADVGQGAIEEINRMRPGDAGVNYGWAQREGTQMYDGPDSPDYTPPVAEYGRGSGPAQGQSITGGYVYRGNIAPIQNHYLFADFISNNVWSVPVSSLVVGQTLAASQFTRLNDDLVPDAGTLNQISSFGRDNAGQIYIVSLGGSIFRIEGAP